MDLSGLPAGGQVFLQEPPQPPRQALFLRKHMRGLFEFHQMPNWSFRLSNNVVIHGFFFFPLDVATLVMVTVGSVRSKTGHHSYTRGSQRHSNTSYI